MPFDVNRRVKIKDGLYGTIRYTGPVSKKSGEWAGVELDEPVGSNDGSHAGTRYFDCAPKHGVFIRTSRLRPVEDEPFDPESSYVLIDKDEQDLCDSTLRPYSLNPEYSPWDDDSFVVRQDATRWNNGEAPDKHFFLKKIEGFISTLHRIRSKLEILQNRVKELEQVEVPYTEQAQVRDILWKMCCANESKDYKKAQEFLNLFKVLVSKYGISIKL